MDPGQAAIIGALVGGATAGIGSYLALIVGDRRRREAERRERLRTIHRTVLNDTRDYMLSLLNVSVARAIQDAEMEKRCEWAEASLRQRVDRGYLGDPELLAEYERVTNRLIRLDLHRIGGAVLVFADPFGPDDASAYAELRRRLTEAFVDVERRIERDEPLRILDRQQVKAIEDAALATSGSRSAHDEPPQSER